MRNTKRILALALTFVTLVSVLAIGASASNWEDTDFYDFDLYYAYYRYLNPRAKEDTTPCYLHITKSDDISVLITANGTNSSDKSGTKRNLTVANGVIVPYVTCRRYVQYSIHSDIYEEGYANATLGFKSVTVDGNNVSGVWSPDSRGTYTDAKYSN